jgi:hypothetical protein
VCACVRACVRACACLCVRASVCLCVRASVCGCARTHTRAHAHNSPARRYCTVAAEARRHVDDLLHEGTGACRRLESAEPSRAESTRTVEPLRAVAPAAAHACLRTFRIACSPSGAAALRRSARPGASAAGDTGSGPSALSCANNRRTRHRRPFRCAPPAGRGRFAAE